MGLTPTQKKFREQMKEIKEKNLYYIPEEKKKEIEIEKLKTQTNRLTNIIVIFILVFGAFIIYQFIMPDHIKTNIIDAFTSTKDEATKLKEIIVSGGDILPDSKYANSTDIKVFNYYGTYTKNSKIYYTYIIANEVMDKESGLKWSNFVLNNIDASIETFKNYNVPEDLKDENILIIKYFNEMKTAAINYQKYLSTNSNNDYMSYISSHSETYKLNLQIREDMINNFEKYDINYEIFEDGTVHYEIKVIR